MRYGSKSLTRVSGLGPQEPSCLIRPIPLLFPLLRVDCVVARLMAASTHTLGDLRGRRRLTDKITGATKVALALSLSLSRPELVAGTASVPQVVVAR